MLRRLLRARIPLVVPRLPATTRLNGIVIHEHADDPLTGGSYLYDISAVWGNTYMKSAQGGGKGSQKAYKRNKICQFLYVKRGGGSQKEFCGRHLSIASNALSLFLFISVPGVVSGAGGGHVGEGRVRPAEAALDEGATAPPGGRRPHFGLGD